MRKKSKLLFLVLFFSVAALFPHDAEIDIEGGNTYKAVRLTPPVYNDAHSKLSDLLIKNENDENVPYFINSSLQKIDTIKETYPMMLINSYTKDDNFFFDYRLAFPRDSDIISTSLEFSTRNAGFAKQVEVFGSYDNINWEFVQSDLLYVVDDKSKLAIFFNRPQKYTHYRLRLANNLEMISFTQAELVFNQEIGEETYFIESFTPQFTVENEDRRTIIKIDGLKNLRLCDISIETDSMFIRNVSALIGNSKELYNLSVNGTSYTDTALPFNRLISPYEQFTLYINNGDDRPIDIRGITVRYFADELVFQGGTGRVYTLEFGVDLTRAAPIYDIERYKTEILKGPIDSLLLGEITYVQPAPPRDELPLRIIFNILTVLIALVLGVLVVLKLAKKN